jgi:hypothetical protein
LELFADSPLAIHRSAQRNKLLGLDVKRDLSTVSVKFSGTECIRWLDNRSVARKCFEQWGLFQSFGNMKMCEETPMDIYVIELLVKTAESGPGIERLVSFLEK